MPGFLGVLVMVAIFAALCACLTFVLHKVLPGTPVPRRTLYSAFGGTGLVMLVPMAAVLGEGLIPIVALLVGWVMLALVIGFPVSWLVARWLEGGHAAHEEMPASE